MESVDVYLNFEKDFNMTYPDKESEAEQLEAPAQRGTRGRK
eukprot:gene2015-2292_t